MERPMKAAVRAMSAESNSLNCTKQEGKEMNKEKVRNPSTNRVRAMEKEVSTYRDEQPMQEHHTHRCPNASAPVHLGLRMAV